MEAEIFRRVRVDFAATARDRPVSSQQMSDAIYGITSEFLAEAFSKEGELKTQLGERQYRPQFDSWLRSKGFDQNTYAHAWNGWHDRWKADPTGMAEAKFHQYVGQLSRKAHFGDVRDMSQDAEHGVTLSQYAEIMVAVSRGGAGIADILGKFGVPNVETWQAAQDAWNKKMAADTSMKLTMQYGELYGKFAGPSLQQEHLQMTAAFLANANGPQDRVDEPEEELTPDLCLHKMQSPKQSERWKYARHYAHMIDLGNVPNKAQATATVRPILIEMIENHDEHTTSDAEDGARKLWDIGVRDDDFRGAVGRCLNRAEERLRSHEAAFAPIQNQAVPERVTLQARIQDFQSLVETMRGYRDEDWSSGEQEQASAFGATQLSGVQAYQGPGPSQSYPQMQMQQGPWGAPQPQQQGGMQMAPPTPSKGGFPKFIVVPLVCILVAGGFFATRGRAMLSSHRATTASSAPAVSTAAAKVPSPNAPVVTTTGANVTETPVAPAASAATPAAAPAKGKAKKKK